ncbi:MAG: pro-sigmaK processing inhibitor BofA family protein [Bacillota bacterium]
MTDLWKTILLAAGGLGFLFALSFLPQGFWRVAGRLALNCACGFAAILVVNYFAGGLIALPFNAFTLAVSAVLGFPGVAALAGLHYCL